MVALNRASRAFLAAVGLFASVVIGCKSAETRNEVTAAPTLEELPDLKSGQERKTAARIDFEGSSKVTRFRIVPEFKPVEPTAEEQAILGDPPESAADELLAFYRPVRGPEHGVSPLEGGARIGSFTASDLRIGVDRPQPRRVSTWGDAGHHANRSSISRSSETTYGETGLEVGTGYPYSIRVGYNPPRSRAARMLRIDN